MEEGSNSLLQEIDEILDKNGVSPSKDRSSSERVEAADSKVVESNNDSAEELKEKPTTGGDIADESEYWANQAKKVKKVVKVIKEDPKVVMQRQADRMARLSNAKIKVPKVQVEVPPKPFSSVKVKKNTPVPSSVYDSSIIQLEDNNKVINAPPKTSLPNSAEVDPKKKVPRKVSTPRETSPTPPPAVAPVTPESNILDSENFDNEMSNIVRRINLVNSKINQEEVKIVSSDRENVSPVPTSLNNGLSNYAGAFQVNSIISVVSGNSPGTILSPNKSNSDGSSSAKEGDSVDGLKKASEWYDEMESTFPDLGETNEQIARAVSYSEQQIDKVTGTISALRKDEIYESAERELTAESSVQDALKAAMEKVAEALRRGEITDLRYETDNSEYTEEGFEEEEDDGEEDHYRRSGRRYRRPRPDSGLLSKIDEVEGEDYSAPSSLQSSARHLLRSESGSLVKTPRSGKSVMFSDDPPEQQHYELEEEEVPPQYTEDGEYGHDDREDENREEGGRRQQRVEEYEVEEKEVHQSGSAGNQGDYSDGSYMARIAAHKERIAQVMDGLSGNKPGPSGAVSGPSDANKGVKVSVVKVPREFIGGDDSNSGARTPEETSIVINTSGDNADIFSHPLFDNSAKKSANTNGESSGEVKEAKGPYEPASDENHNDFVSDADLSKIEEAFLQSTNPSPFKQQQQSTSEDRFTEKDLGKSENPETQLPTSSDVNYIGGGLDRYPYVSSATDEGDVVGRLMAISNSIMNIEKNYENIEHSIENYMDLRVSLTPSTAELNFRADVDDIFGSGAAASAAAGSTNDGTVAGRLGGISIYKTEDAHFDPTVDMAVPAHFKQMNNMVQKQQSRIKHIKDALNSLEEAAINQDADLFEIPKFVPASVTDDDGEDQDGVRGRRGQKGSKTTAAVSKGVRTTPPVASKSVPSGQFMKPTAASARRNMNVEKNIVMSMANNIVTSVKSRRVSKSGGRSGAMVDDYSEQGDADLFRSEGQRGHRDNRYEEEYVSGSDAAGSASNGPKKKKRKAKKKKAAAALRMEYDFDEIMENEEYFDARPSGIEDDLFQNLGGYLEQQQRILKKNKALNYNQLLSKASRDMNISSNSDAYADRELAAVLNSKKKRQLEDEKLLMHFQHLGKIEQRIVSTMAASNDVNKSSIVGYTNSKIEKFQQDRMLQEFRKSRDSKDLYRQLAKEESGYGSGGGFRYNESNQHPQNTGNQQSEGQQRSANERYYNPYNQPLSESNASDYYKFKYNDASAEHNQNQDPRNNRYPDDNGEYEASYSRTHEHQAEDIRSDYKMMQEAQRHSTNNNSNNNYTEEYSKDTYLPNSSEEINAQFQSYQEFIREHQQQHQLNPPSSLSIHLDPPTPVYKASSYHPIPAAATVTSAVVSANSSTVASGPNSHSSPQHTHGGSLHNSPSQSHQYQAPSVLPKINFKISDALLKDPEPFVAKIEKSARGSFVVDSHELSPRVINRKTNQPVGTTRFMNVIHSNSGGANTNQRSHYHNSDDISEISMENDDVSMASSSVDTTANNTQITNGSNTKRTTADEVYGRLKKVNKSPRAQRADAEKELSMMLKRQHEYDIIANQINVNLNNQQNQPHSNRLLADNKLPPSSMLSESDDAEGAKENAVRAPSAAPAEGLATSAAKPKKAKGIATGKGTKKKKKSSSNDDDFDSDDFEEVIAQSIKVFDLKPPKAVKPSNQGNPRLKNLKL